jgi:hypothetical protein
MFHAPRAIRAEPGSTWVGSLALRPVGAPVGLRGGKLRIYSKPAEGDRTLQRKDAALAGAPVAAAAPGDFARIYVSNTLGAPDTAYLLMTVLFDHAAGPVDFTLDLGAPRLVEGLDLGQVATQPLPRFSGPGQRLEPDAGNDPLGLLPHLEGITPGETRQLLLRLPAGLDDRGLTGRTARITCHAQAVLRRQAPPLDDALARTLGFADLAALQAEAASRAARRCAERSEARLRADLRAALLASAADVALPEPALAAELVAIWPALVAASGRPPGPDDARAAADRSLRLRLVIEALARQLGLPDADVDPASPDRPDPAALEAQVLAQVLARAQVTQRPAPPDVVPPDARREPSGRGTAPVS